MDFKMKRNLFLPEGDDFSKSEVDVGSEAIHFEGRHRLASLRGEKTKQQKSAKTGVRIGGVTGSTGAEGEKKTYKELLQEMMKKR